MNEKLYGDDKRKKVKNIWVRRFMKRIFVGKEKYLNEFFFIF
jgi:hypothetical protein